jgi:hypothetical protein
VEGGIRIEDTIELRRSAQRAQSSMCPPGGHDRAAGTPCSRFHSPSASASSSRPPAVGNIYERPREQHRGGPRRRSPLARPHLDPLWTLEPRRKWATAVCVAGPVPVRATQIETPDAARESTELD